VSEPTDVTTTTVEDVPSTETTPVDPLVEQELLVEDVSIDGMCGVY
jgi:mycofactocin precursor